MSDNQIRVQVLRGFRWDGTTFTPKDEPMFIRLPADIAAELAASGKVKLPVDTVQPALASEPVPSPATVRVRVLRSFLLMGEPVPVTDGDGNPTVIELHGGFARQLIAAGQAEIAPEEAPPEPEPAD